MRGEVKKEGMKHTDDDEIGKMGRRYTTDREGRQGRWEGSTKQTEKASREGEGGRSGAVVGDDSNTVSKCQ